MSEEKLNELKEKVAGLQEELKELTPEEVKQVTGGSEFKLRHCDNCGGYVQNCNRPDLKGTHLCPFGGDEGRMSSQFQI